MSDYVRAAHASALFEKSGRARVRGRLDLQLTERCNNRCAHCCVSLPANDAAAQERELSADEFVAILEQAAELGFLSVRMTGGEPLLRDDFADIYLRARKLGLGVMLFTNATLMTPELADLLRRIPPREKVEVTVYGTTPDVYESTSRVAGSFEAAWRGIRLLQDRRIPFFVKGAILPHTGDNWRDLESWAESIPWMTGRVMYAMFFQLRCRRDDERRNATIREVRCTHERAWPIVARDLQAFVKEQVEFLTKFRGVHGDQLFTCGTPGCVDPYGVLYPCVELRDPRTGYDLRSGSLREAITEFLPQVRTWEATNEDYKCRCGVCYLRDLCDQCPARSYAEHGTLDTPVDYFCEITHAQARGSRLVADTERAWEVRDWESRLAEVARRHGIAVADMA